MIPTSWLLFAESNVRTTFEFKNIQSNADWILPIAAFALATAFVVYMYVRDAADLHPLVAVLLTALRTATFLGLLILYLYPQLRIDEEKTFNSQALVLVDTSLSMGLSDIDSGSGGGGSSRIQQVASALRQSDFIKRLRRTHDVFVAHFDQRLYQDRVLSFPKLVPGSSDGAAEGAAEPESGTVPAFASAKTGLSPLTPKSDEGAKPGGSQAGGLRAARESDWADLLKLGGEETRLGESLRQLISSKANAPLSGVIVLTDGGQNAGPGAEAAIEAARQVKVPVFPVGVGSDKLPPNVRVAALNPPPRAYPGDPYSVTGVIQAWRMPGQTVTVQLLSRPTGSGSDAGARGTGDVVDTDQVTLGGDGEEVPVKFQLTPEEVGRRTLCLKVVPPKNDRDSNDNMLEADIEIVDRKNRVLLFAGGPMREYQFLRNQLYRDKSVTSDVELQTARPGISQEANKILDDFPETREDMYLYDCVVAFDPDWQELTSTQIDLLESWVAEQGGGLIVVAGPVYTGRQINGWTQDPAMAKIRALYPVEFQRRLTAIDDKMQEAEEAWALDFTREGLEADFLALSDSPVTSRQAWNGFNGVFSYYPVRGPKQGATVLARFSDPRTAVGGQQPVYLAWQFYGSGRVCYLGSGEMWRLRERDPSYFEQFYTKLVRHISKGRLLRGSIRGMLLVGQESYRLGNAVGVQAYRLTTAQLEPLDLPAVTLQVIQPDQSVQNVTMRRDPGRAGSYAGQFTVLQEGDYRLELPLPDSSEERLTHRIHVEIPNLEREHPQRNDALLSEIAQKTGGKYFVGLDAILSRADVDPLVSSLPDRTKTTIITGPSPLWEEQWLRWMMYALFGLLCLEWLIRRLMKLA